MSAPSNSYNYAGIALKDNVNPAPAQPTIFLKYSDFSSNIEEETSEDTANIGGSTTLIGYDRTQVNTSPEYTDKLRFKEGLELLCYGALGGDREGTPISDTGFDDPVRYSYTWQPASSRETLPTFTMVKGFNMWTTESSTGAADVLKPKIYDNLKIDELEFKFEAKGDIQVTSKFMGDAPIFNVVPADITKTFFAKSRNVKQDDVTIYYGSPDTTSLSELSSSECVKDLTVTFKNNLSESECFGLEFGKNSADEGNFECEISGTFELNRATAREEAAWITGTKEGYYARTEIYERQFVVVINNVDILIYNEETEEYEDSGLDYELVIKLPKVAISKWQPSESGDDSATVEFEGATILSTEATDGNVGTAPAIVTCKTDIVKLEYPSERKDDEGHDLPDSATYFTLPPR